MNFEEFKRDAAALSPAQQRELSAYLSHLRHAADPEYQKLIDSRLSDRDPSHWLTLDEFEKRLEQE